MKSLILLLIICLAGCKSNSEGSNSGSGYSDTLSRVDWQDTVLNLGDVTLGERRSFSFRFKNVGDNALRFEKIEPTCSCTLIDNNRQKNIAPGRMDSITASINFQDEVGLVTMKIYTLSNTEKQFQVLKIVANVIKKD